MAHNYRGVAYTTKRQLDLAIADFDKALEIEPKMVGTYLNRGAAYYGKRQCDRAIADYNAALKINPSYA